MVILLVLVLFSSPAIVQFAPALPPGVPDPTSWERIAGEAHFGDPMVSVWYDFYVNPERPALYSLVRYRIRAEGGLRDDGYQPSERLQWHLSGTKILRRFECRETKTLLGEPTPCDWRELMPGSAEYRRETPVIIWLYGLHRSRLETRESGSD